MVKIRGSGHPDLDSTPDPPVRVVRMPGQRRFAFWLWRRGRRFPRALLAALNALVGGSTPIGEPHGRETVVLTRRGLRRIVDTSTQGVPGERVADDVVNEAFERDPDALSAALRTIGAIDPPEAEQAQRALEQAAGDRKRWETDLEPARERERAAESRVLDALNGDEREIPEGAALPGLGVSPNGPSRLRRRCRTARVLKQVAGVAEFASTFAVALLMYGIPLTLPAMRASLPATVISGAFALAFTVATFVWARSVVEWWSTESATKKAVAVALCAGLVVAVGTIAVARETVMHPAGDDGSGVWLAASIAFSAAFVVLAIGSEATEHSALLALREGELFDLRIAIPAALVSRAEAGLRACDAVADGISARASQVTAKLLEERRAIAAERQAARQYQAARLATQVARHAPEIFDDELSDVDEPFVAWAHGTHAPDAEAPAQTEPTAGDAQQEPSALPAEKSAYRRNGTTLPWV